MKARTQSVKIINNNEFIMGDRYDGTVYTFYPGVPVIIGPEVAWHLFNWPSQEDEMKSYTCRRFGWDRRNHVGADRDKEVANDLVLGCKSLVDFYWENLAFEPCQTKEKANA